MFYLPGTTLDVRSVGESKDPVKVLVEVVNSGSVPAIGVTLTRSGHDDKFTADKSFLLLDPGESAVFETNSSEGVTVFALNISGGMTFYYAHQLKIWFSKQIVKRDRTPVMSARSAGDRSVLFCRI